MLLNYLLVVLLVFLSTLMLFSAKDEAPQPPRGESKGFIRRPKYFNK